MLFFYNLKNKSIQADPKTMNVKLVNLNGTQILVKVEYFGMYPKFDL
jgi:hypothetical protein